MCPDLAPERWEDVMKQQQEIKPIEIHQANTFWIGCLVVVLIALMIGLQIAADAVVEWLAKWGVFQ